MLNIHHITFHGSIACRKFYFRLFFTYLREYYSGFNRNWSRWLLTSNFNPIILAK